jgi:hypothetical protein
MNGALKKISFLVGLGILGVSMYWSQDGFNFDTAGDSGYTREAILIGWFLAVAVTVVQFVFSSNFRELNMSLILLGAIAYVYSIDTNVTGILHFMGSQPDVWWARGLGFLLDATAEPLIAWSLGVSRDGDFLGNIVKTISSFFNNLFDGARTDNRRNQPQNQPFRPKSDGIGRDSEKTSHDLPIFPTMNDRRNKKHVNMSKLQSTTSQKSKSDPASRFFLTDDDE